MTGMLCASVAYRRVRAAYCGHHQSILAAPPAVGEYEAARIDPTTDRDRWDVWDDGGLERHGEDVLEALLVDQTTRRNIICADSEYSDHGYGFDCMDEIAIPQLTGKYAGLIRTRADKALESQSHRKRDDDEQGDEADGDDGDAPTFDSRL